MTDRRIAPPRLFLSGSIGLIIAMMVIPSSAWFLPATMQKVWADSVVATVNVGSGPNGIVYNPNNNRVYVANTNAHSISLIDSATNLEILQLTGGLLFPKSMTYNPSNGNLYVTNIVGSSVYVIDGTTNSLIDTIPVGLNPWRLGFNPDNGNVYVANHVGNSVSVIDGATNTVIDTIPVGLNPVDVAHNPNNGNMYVTNSGGNSVSVIDGTTNTVVDTISVGDVPIGVAHNPDNGNLYVTNSVSQTVSVIDSTNTIVDTIVAPGFPWDIAHNPDNGNMYVVNFSTTSVSVIDNSNTVVETIIVGASPQEIAYNPDNGNMYVTNEASNTVSVIAPSSSPPISANLSITPTIHDFGEVQEGLTSSLGTWTVTNEGETTSSPITMSLGNTNADQFSILNDNCTGVELAFEESCSADVQFAPTSPGLKETTLEASAADLDPASASLMGTGTPAPEPTSVVIDIKPGSDENPINVKSKGVLPVAILGSETFDVGVIDASSILFGGSTPQSPDKWAYEDVNGDGFTDIIAHFRSQSLGFSEGDTEGCMTGHFDSTDFEACDSVRIISK